MLSLLKFKKDNKGDTLLVVIVGMMLLIILGTAILSSASLNYSFRFMDSNQKKTFYTAEEAIDEVYAGIGQDVMKSMEYAYSYILNNMMTRDDNNNLVTTDNKELNKIFRNIFYYYLTGNNSHQVADTWNTDVKPKISGECSPMYRANSEGQRNALEEYLQNMTTGGAGSPATPTVTIPSYNATGSDVIEEKTKIAISSTGIEMVMNYFVIKDVTVSCESNDGVTSSVSTDIVVEMPLIDINFSEVSTINYNELFKYSLIAEGDNSQTGNPTLDINTNTVINGNIYAGKQDSSKKVGIDLMNKNLDIIASNIVTSGEIKLYNSKFNAIKKNEVTPLKVWAKNITTTGVNDEVNILDADCIIKDDIEVNGDGSKITISGNYFGIGYRADTDGSEANSTENDTVYFETPSLPPDHKYEHEDSSAILINGKDADVNLFDLNILLLGGRAYVDLFDQYAIAEDAANSTYMTGESISIRGNQEAYLADITDNTLFNFLEPEDTIPYNVIKSNPVTYAFYQDNVEGKNILTNKTVAKRVGNNVYFYMASVDPVEQTKRFEDYFEIASNKKTIRDKAANLGVKHILIDEVNTKIFSVGSLMQVDQDKVESQRVLLLKHNVENNNNATFTRYINDITLRYKAMLTELMDYGDITSTTVNSMYHSKINSSTKTPLDVYVNSANFQEVFTGMVDDVNTGDNLYDGGNTYKVSYDNFSADVLTAEERAQYNNLAHNSCIILTKEDNYVVDASVNNGIIISSGNVEIVDDFRGIILCAGDIKVADIGAEINLMACPDIVEWLAETDVVLGKCLEGYRATAQSGDGESNGHMKLNDISYQDLVSYTNWQKNAINEDIDNN